jgi:transcriptional regulator
MAQDTRSDNPQFLKGTVDILLLKTLSQGPMHGYGISSWIRRHSAGELGLEDAALYQALHRLERRGWVAADWGVSENNRRAKYYQLTDRGRRQLHEQEHHWRRYAEAVFKILETA